MKYLFDLDGTLCLTPSTKNYAAATPYVRVIERVNDLYDQGHDITIYTARGGTSGIDYHELTVTQLRYWAVKYHRLIDQGKPDFDIFIDDKAMSAKDWRLREGVRVTGLVASAFDLLHAGHCLYLKEAKSACDHLVAALHEDPSVERSNKNAPIQSVDERRIQLEATKYVDEIIVYKTEGDLLNICKSIKPDVRILGSDYIGKTVTGQEHCKTIYYHHRNHNYSSTELRNRLRDGAA